METIIVFMKSPFAAQCLHSALCDDYQVTLEGCEVSIVGATEDLLDEIRCDAGMLHISRVEQETGAQ